MILHLLSLIPTILRLRSELAVPPENSIRAEFSTARRGTAGCWDSRSAKPIRTQHTGNCGLSVKESLRATVSRARPFDQRQKTGSFRIPCSAGRPHPLSTIMPSVAVSLSGCRPGARPLEVCPSARALSSGKRRSRGRQRIARLSADQKPTSARQFAAAPSSPPISFLASPISPCAPE
jgi:hypothetical protein